MVFWEDWGEACVLDGYKIKARNTKHFSKHNDLRRIIHSKEYLKKKVRFSKLFEILLRENKWLSPEAHDYLY